MLFKDFLKRLSYDSFKELMKCKLIAHDTGKMTYNVHHRGITSAVKEIPTVFITMRRDEQPHRNALESAKPCQACCHVILSQTHFARVLHNKRMVSSWYSIASSSVMLKMISSKISLFESLKKPLRNS
jgi:hypothetical protein